MTDKEKLEALLNEWGVPYADASDGIAVGREAPDSPKVTGYGGFYTVFEFDTEGGFVQMGAWE